MKSLIKAIGIVSAMLMSSFTFADYLNTEYLNVEKVKTEVDQKVEGKIVVQQFLWHKCVHCYKLDPLVDKWVQSKPDYIVFERVPVVWSTKNAEDALFYNYAKTMQKVGKITEAQLTKINEDLFKVVFEEEKELTSENVIHIFKPYGIESAEELTKLTKSFAASNENVKSKKLTTDYGIAGVPMFVINGKYIVGFQTLKTGGVTPENLFKTVETVAKGELDKNK